MSREAWKAAIVLGLTTIIVIGLLLWAMFSCRGTMN